MSTRWSGAHREAVRSRPASHRTGERCSRSSGPRGEKIADLAHPSRPRWMVTGLIGSADTPPRTTVVKLWRILRNFPLISTRSCCLPVNVRIEPGNRGSSYCPAARSSSWGPPPPVRRTPALFGERIPEPHRRRGPHPPIGHGFEADEEPPARRAPVAARAPGPPILGAWA